MNHVHTITLSIDDGKKLATVKSRVICWRQGWNNVLLIPIMLLDDQYALITDDV